MSGSLPGGLRLDGGGGAVEEALGEELWELVRPDREPPVKRFAPGISPPAAARVVERLESAVTVDELSQQADRILDEVERAVVGKREALELVLLGILADGHVLIEDFPGLAKTLIARAFAQVTSIGFTRVQFTPDLMPSDVTGSSIYNQREGDFEFRPGPDLHQPPPRRRDQPRPSEDAGRAAGGDAGAAGHDRGRDAPARAAVPRARDAEPDRVRGHLSAARRRSSTASCSGSASATPTARTSGRCSQRRLERSADEVELDQVVSRDELIEMQRALEQVHVDRSVGLYMVDLVAATREAPGVQVGASPRGSLALLKLSRGRAALEGRDFVTPDDVKAVAVPALAHRLSLRPELWVQRLRPEDLVLELLGRVPTPKAEAEPEPEPAE